MGLNDRGQLGLDTDKANIPVPQEVLVPEPVVAVAAGYYHTLALAESGNVWAWGTNDKGQLGVGSDVPSAGEPRLLKTLQGEKVTSIAAGADHSLALTAHGEVFSWGENGHGQLGHSKAPGLGFFRLARPEWKPRLLRGLETQKVTQISAGQMHSACVTHEGQALMWGSNRFWELGLPQAVDYHLPTEVPGLHHVAQLACGGLHSLALLHSGSMLAWGANQNGVLGLGPGKQSKQTSRHGTKAGTPAQVPGLAGVEQVSAGWKHSAAVASGGRLFTWGWGGSQGTALSVQETTSTGGQLGLGDENDYWAPTRVEWLQLGEAEAWAQQEEAGGDMAWRVLQVSCGLNHTAAVVELVDDVARQAAADLAKGKQ
ncbi:hypothetical protein N2152v2_008961 [Parachlorella kessleri]